MILISLFLSLCTFISGNEKLMLYNADIPELDPFIRYNGKYISIFDSDSVYIDMEDIVIEDDINISIQDQILGPTQWNLDILDNKIDSKYSYAYSGLGSIVYVIDSGILRSSEFDNRINTGMSFVHNDNNTDDCIGHGTHVSSLIGSRTYGVAKNVTIVPIKIFGCSRTTYVSTVLRAIYWIINQPKGIVNLSIGGSYSIILNDAIKDLINAGFIVVSAAGNNGLDACNFSPSSEPNSIVVGCSSYEKTICSFSNEGSCVTLFAPGSKILGLTNNLGKTIYSSGTSYSAPHVSGVAATLYEKYPGITQKDLKQLIVKIAAYGTLTEFKMNSPNLEVREFVNVDFPMCSRIHDARNCKNTSMCNFIRNYGCRSFNFCGFRTKQECLLRRRCKYTSGKCNSR